jgi:hypothetical protein
MSVILPSIALLLKLAAAVPLSTNGATSGTVQIASVAQPQELSANITTITREVSAASWSVPSCGSGVRRPGPSQLRSKKGVGYPQGNTFWANSFSNIAWTYNWYSDPHWWSTSNSPNLRSDLEYVPMLWGADDKDHVKNWVPDLMTKGKKYTHLLAFNEPDRGDQSNLSPADAAMFYRTKFQLFACSARLGAPAVSNGHDGLQALQYLEQFLNACSDCYIDFIPIHIYKPANEIDNIKRYIEDAIKVGGGRPVWITEFAATSFANNQERDNFFREMIPWMNQHPMIERYSYQHRPDLGLPIVNGDGSLTELGWAYNNA